MLKIVTVKSLSQVEDFVMFPFKLYKDCNYWVPPIIKEEIEAMDTSKNPVFKNAEAEFYLAFDEKENIVGRIAAIVNWVEIKDQKKNKLRFGWYDTIDDLDVSRKLIEKVLEKSGWKKTDVDLFEVNEAFAVVPMAVMKDIGISNDILNIYGGACALGHPVGASGTRIVTTLINALKKNNLKKGVASLCIGGGEATALTLEIIN